jgi:PPM family protein phosphatase
VDVPKVTAHGRSDVGRVRTGNEDALFIGRTLFAVADGMGGHRGGEVASATALQPLEALDGHDFPDGDTALSALTDAVAAANTEVSRRSQNEPDLEGMGTTLTALLVDGFDAHLVHVGDSRAYLARGDRFVQLTADHTLVQALIDQGRITRDDVATHPHRSVITRAVGVADDVEVDAMHVALRDGDRIMLCSDGLSGVLDDERIAALVRDLEPAAAVDALIDAANAAGGPDNITVLIVTVAGATDPDATTPLPRVVRIRTDDPAAAGTDWAARYSDLGGRGQPGGRSGGRGTSSAAPTPSRRERLLGGTFDRVAIRIVIAVVTVAVIVVGILLGARVILDRSYLVGVDAEEIVIYRGFDVQVGPLDLKRVYERAGVPLDQVQPALRPVYVAGRPAADLSDARRIIRNIPLVDPDAAGETGRTATSAEGSR